MYFVILFIPPLYFLIKKKYGGFIANLLLMLIAGVLILSLIFMLGGFLFWILAVGHAAWQYRQDLLMKQADRIAQKISNVQTK